MKKHTTTALLLVSIAVLILDSRCAAHAARDALKLCGQVLIPCLFPLFVVSGMLLPGLKVLRIPRLSRLLGIPVGSEGVFLLGFIGGFPVGASCVAQAAGDGALHRQDAERMLGLCSFCGPSFLFGVLPQIIPMKQVIALFLIQLETGLLLSAFWPGQAKGAFAPSAESITLTQAVQRAVRSMLLVCSWVLLAGVAAGFLRRWFFPLMPRGSAMLMTGLLELTNGIFALPAENTPVRFLCCAVFVCFGGVSVLLQIGGLASSAGLRMGQCAAQKTIHALLGAIAASAYLHLGFRSFFLPLVLLFAKIALEIPRRMVYNNPRKEGI